MIDIDNLEALDKQMKPSPWYAWLSPGLGDGIEDNCITTITQEQYDKKVADTGYRGLSLAEEVIGCSEWMRAEDADLAGIAEMRNQLPELIAYLKRLEANYVRVFAEGIDEYEEEDMKLARADLEKIKRGV